MSLLRSLLALPTPIDPSAFCRFIGSSRFGATRRLILSMRWRRDFRSRTMTGRR